MLYATKPGCKQVTDLCLCAVSFLFLQVVACWNMVVKMVRTHLMGPMSQSWVKWPSIMGTRLLYLLLLLLLSTCLGQDTEGKGFLRTCPLLLGLTQWVWVFWVCLSLGSDIRIVFVKFMTGWASQAAVSRQEFPDSLFMCNITRWLTMKRALFRQPHNNLPKGNIGFLKISWMQKILNSF